MKLFFNFSAYAHNTGQPHAETPAAIDPVVAVIVVVVIAIAGFLIWKFVLKSKEPPVQKKTEASPIPTPNAQDKTQKKDDVKAG